jgi:hypothetical protein
VLAPLLLGDEAGAPSSASAQLDVR